MKNKTFLDSVKCAFNGLIFALRTEKNYKYYLGISLFFLVLNIYFRIPLYGYLFHMITTLGVFSAECMNTAIERTIDYVDIEINPKIKVIKDIAASSVLCWGFAFFISEFILIGSVIMC